MKQLDVNVSLPTNIVNLTHMIFSLDSCDFDPDPCHPWRTFHDPRLNAHCKHHYVVTCVFGQKIKKIGCKVEALVNQEAEAEAEAFENHEAEAEARLPKI